MIPARYSAPLLARKWLTPNSIELRFPRPAGFAFRPGQRIRVFHETLEREYSLASGPGDRELKLLIRVFPQGRVSTFLSTVEIGAPLSFYGPMGYFVFQTANRTPVFVATGTGVAPLIAMCRAGIQGFICLHGARLSADRLYAGDLAEKAALYVPCLSQSDGRDEGVFAGRVTAYLDQMDATGPYDFYLCGHQVMIRDAFQIIDKRFAGSHVHSEVFY